MHLTRPRNVLTNGNLAEGTLELGQGEVHSIVLDIFAKPINGL